MKHARYISLILILITILVSCKEKLVPRPRGYFRIDFPAQTAYKDIPKQYPYQFKINNIASIVDVMDDEGEYWTNIKYKNYNATIHISYLPITNNLYNLVEDARGFVYKHVEQASAIDQQVFTFPEKNVYGILYDIKGDAATPMQFFSTDSVNHFVRGVFYIEANAKQDSLRPIISYVEKDIYQIIESFSWQ